MLKRIPSRSSSKKATSRKSTRSSRSSRSNGSNMSLREALAARQNSKSRKNPSKGKMSLRQVLAARSNGGVAARRGELSSEIAELSQKYRQKQRAFASNPSETNRRLVEYYRSMLQNAKDGLKKMSSSMKGGTRKPTKKRKTTSRKSTAKKSTSRKSTAKKSTSRKTKSGVANTTASYKRLRKSGTKSKFTRAFNSAFKKAKRSGKSVTSAQRSAIAAGKKAASARKNPSSAINRSLAALKVNAKAAKAEGRQNPRKKKATRKSSKRKSTARSSRKPRTTSAINVHARKSKQYKALRSAAKKTAFLKEYRVAFKKQDNKRGVTEAQAAARAALIANSKINSAARKRKNPVSATASTVSRMNPRKKTTRRKASKKKTTRKSSSKKTSMRASSLEAIAKKSSLYKRLKSATLKKKFVTHFKKVHAKIARKAKSAAQANARASMSAWGTVSKGNTRKNPSTCRTNPRKKSTRKTSSRRKSSSTKRARGQRLKGSMRKSAKQALSVAGVYTYKIEMKGKVHTIKVSKTSKEYKAAKKGGLSKVKMTKLRGKKNTPTSLNLRSVYKVVDGRPTKTDFQRAINAWAGAVDGGKVRGVSKKMRSRTRMNPSSLRKHTVNAISNPMPQSMATRIHRHNEGSGMHTAKLVGIGVGSAYGTAIASNFFSSLLHRDFALNVTPEDRKNNSSKKMLAEALPPALFGIAGGIGLYQKYVKKSDVPDAWVAFSGGMVAGAIASAASRTIVKGMSKFIPGFRSVSEYGGDSITLKEVADAATTPATTTPVVEPVPTADETKLEGFLLNLQDKGHNMSNFAQRRNGLGLYTSVPVPSQMGTYVADVGNYVPQRSNPVDRVYGLSAEDHAERLYGLSAEDHAERLYGLGAEDHAERLYGLGAEDHAERLYGLGAEDHAERLYGIARADIVSGMHHRSNPAEMPDSGISPVGANTQMVPNLAPRIPDGMYNINASLKEDMELIEPLSNDELASEGLTNVYSSGEQLHIIRAVPDVARQIAESNFGNIIGPSRVVNGAVLVLASIFDTPQNPVLTDRLRLNRAPEVPKGASFPQAGGVFSRVAFSSHLPSVNNQASFQEFGVRVKQA